MKFMFLSEIAHRSFYVKCVLSDLRILSAKNDKTANIQRLDLYLVSFLKLRKCTFQEKRISGAPMKPSQLFYFIDIKILRRFNNLLPRVLSYPPYVYIHFCSYIFFNCTQQRELSLSIHFIIIGDKFGQLQ